MDADEKSNQTILLNKVRFYFLQCLRPSAKSASAFDLLRNRIKEIEVTIVTWLTRCGRKRG